MPELNGLIFKDAGEGKKPPLIVFCLWQQSSVDQTTSRCSEICSPETMKREDEAMKRVD